MDFSTALKQKCYFCSMDFSTLNLTEVNALNQGTLMETLGIECIALGDRFLAFRMPVDHRTHQPMGLLHGGASAALIETIGSFGSYLMANLEKERPVGLEMNAQHVRAVRSGFVLGTGTLLHQGKTTHVWNVDIIEETTKKLVCTGRLTMLMVKK